MKKKFRSLLIDIGPGYHLQIRQLHSMIKDKCDSSMLFFDIDKGIDKVGEDLRYHYTMNYSDFSNTYNIFENYIKKGNFDLIGISLMSHHWEVYILLSKIIRQVLPKCKIITGGVHAWHIDPLGTLEYCDYICAAEGEELFSELIDRLSANADDSPLRIPGMIEKHNDEVIRTPTKKYMPIDNLPVPTYGDKNTYTIISRQVDRPVFLNEDPMVESSDQNSGGFIHIGRGCAFTCTFCINSVIENPTARIRSVDKVISEIKEMLKICKNIKTIFFMDEIFPVRQSFLPEFCKKYKEEIGLPFMATLYPHMLSEEKIKMLKSAGLCEITMGLQSGSERIRSDIYNRKDTNKKVLEEKTLLAKYNIMISYDIIIRNPYETENDLSITLDLIHKFKRPFYLKIYTLAFYPKHPLTIKALRDKMVDPKEVDATIGYLPVTTPHKVLLKEHYFEKQFPIWHRTIRNKMLEGYKKESYYLLISYHGFWYIPQFFLRFLCAQFKKGNQKPLYIFSYLLQCFLVMQNITLFKYFYITLLRLRQRGPVFVIKKIISKFKNRFIIKHSPQSKEKDKPIDSPIH